VFQRLSSCRVALAVTALFTGLLLDERASTAATVSTLQVCAHSQPITSNTSFPEVRGVATHHVKLWALVFYHPPAFPGKAVKVVLRMTSTGPFHVWAVGPIGQTVQHTWIEAHGGSNWNRPGDEWGTGWTFPTAGCWRLYAKRGPASGNMWLNVVQPSPSA
jgi:hypothetical protein